MNRARKAASALVFSLCVFVVLSGAQTSGEGESASNIRLSSFEVVQVELRKPVQARDVEGKNQTYARAYLVTLKGTFPRDQGLGMELYIGDYRVPEYGGTRDGLYFRLYDQRLLPRLEGKEFGYRFGSKELRSFGVKFSVKGAQKTVKEGSTPQ